MHKNITMEMVEYLVTQDASIQIGSMITKSAA